MTGDRWVAAIVIGVLGLIVVLGMIRCASNQNEPTYEMQTVTLQDGTQVPCLFYHQGGGSTSVGGMSCDWSRAVHP